MTQDNQPLLEARSIYHIYSGKAEHASVVALKGVSLKVGHGELIAVVGPSGSGKSSLLRILGGLMRPTAGTVLFNNFDITKTPEEGLTLFRRSEVGFVFQEGNLLPDLSAFDNINQSMALAGIPYEVRKKRAMELLELMGVANRRNQIATKLSGGERQRVAIARAMANKPKLIIADEPTGNVDFATSKRLLELFQELRDNTGTSFILATHSTHVASYAERSLEMRDGLLLGQHGLGIDLSTLDTSRMVILDSDNRLTLPEPVLAELGIIPQLWSIAVEENRKIVLTPLTTVDDAEEEGEEVFHECKVCSAKVPLSAEFCTNCGAKF